jgi:hypothetical protein
MLVRKNNETMIMTVISGSHEWSQCFEAKDQNVYNLDNSYILFEYEHDYALVRIVDKCRKKDVIND